MRRRTRHVRKKGKSKSGYVYLGKRIRDLGKKGIDRPSEVDGILNAIVKDYRGHKISKLQFNRRTAILGLATVKDKDLTEKQKGELLAYINFIRVSYGLLPLKLKRGYDKTVYNQTYNELTEKVKKIVNQKLEELYK
ncbi:MAG: hypothetical protein ACP6IU_14995 [Candidatus Asgardarchaeia archaeon]